MDNHLEPRDMTIIWNREGTGVGDSTGGPELQVGRGSMTDLQRARRMLREWGDEADTVIADELAAARLESAARAAEKAYANGFRRGAAEMRERAAAATAFCCFECSRVIRALPLTPEEPQV